MIRGLLLIVVIFFTAELINSGCKSVKTKNSSSGSIIQEQPVKTDKTQGTVSHQFKETGCPSVIIVHNTDGELILIPKDNLPVEFDVDGQVIYFTYRLLKMPNPQGCNKGMPAELVDITKK
jgi:uncharacterized protein YceK